MNNDVTNLVLAWAECSKAVWVNLFKEQHNAIDHYQEIENSLFRSLVTDKMAVAFVEPSNLEVMYQSKVDGPRQVCSRQKSGNIFCESKNVSLDADVFYKLRAIDPLGTMMDGEPYAEVVYQGESYILEPITALRFFMRMPDASRQDPCG
jgi:hypothetical protein